MGMVMGALLGGAWRHEDPVFTDTKRCLQSAARYVAPVWAGLLLERDLAGVEERQGEMHEDRYQTEPCGANAEPSPVLRRADRRGWPHVNAPGRNQTVSPDAVEG
jgi:hypothetical protein